MPSLSVGRPSAAGRYLKIVGEEKYLAFVQKFQETFHAQLVPQHLPALSRLTLRDS